MPGQRMRLGLMASGRGSNVEAILDAIGAGRLDAEAVLLICDRRGAGVIGVAASRGVPVELVERSAFPSRTAQQAAIAELLVGYGVDLVALAGFAAILGSQVVDRFSGRILNIHPSLLPSFPGLHTHRQALQAGVKLHGCTVHFVTPSLDSGPIVIQAAVPVLAGDTEEALAARVLEAEHRIYPQAVRWMIEDRLEFLRGDVVRVRGSGVGSDCVISPRDPP